MKHPPASVAAASLTLLDPTQRRLSTLLAELNGLDQPGVYAWFVDDDGATDLASGLGEPVKAGLIYAGLAGAGTSSATLGSRIRRNHLGGNIRGSTFRLTLASSLRNQLRLTSDGFRHLTDGGETRLTAWMATHLAVAVSPFDESAALDQFETEILDALDPPLNLAKRPPSPIRARLTDLRRPFTRRSSRDLQVPAKRTAPPGVKRTPSVRSDGGFTPEELARELGLPNAKQVRGFLRQAFPRGAGELWSRWGPLSPGMEAAVRKRFGGQR